MRRLDRRTKPAFALAPAAVRGFRPARLQQVGQFIQRVQDQVRSVVRAGLFGVPTRVGSGGQQDGYRSVADVTDPASLQKVRDFKKAKKAEAKATGQTAAETAARADAQAG